MRAMPYPPSRWGGRPVWAEIDLDALAHNVRLLAGRAAPARLWAVVKANAYGHGAVACGESLIAIPARSELRRRCLQHTDLRIRVVEGSVRVVKFLLIRHDLFSSRAFIEGCGDAIAAVVGRLCTHPGCIESWWRRSPQPTIVESDAKRGAA